MLQMLWRLLLVTLINGSASQTCSPFVPEFQLVGLEFSFQSYRNWASSIDTTAKFLVIYPKTGTQVVSVVSWAYSTGRNVRVQGYRHSYPPLTVSESDDPCRVIIIDMTRYLKQVKMGSRLSLPNTITNVGVVVAEPGVTMDELLTFAERNGYGMEHYPIIGSDATLGGVLAIGGHGAGIPSINEKLTSRGFFGSVSNLIREIKAVVWEPRVSNYILKTFSRSDPDMAAFLVHLGRAIITEVSILVRRNFNMRCLSIVDIPGSELFAQPTPNRTSFRTMSTFLDRDGRGDAIWFPFTPNPWLKLWQVTDVKPESSEITRHPYNYQFSFSQINPQTPGPVFGPQNFQSLVVGLGKTLSGDIWGASKNTLLYLNSTPTPQVYAGFVVLTRRANIQLVLHDIAESYLNLFNKYGNRGEYPIDQYIKLRVTGLDEPLETFIPGAVQADISPTSPIPARPDFDVGVWMNTLFTTKRAFSSSFMKKFEEWAYTRFNGSDSVIRPEWSKTWAYTDAGPFTNQKLLHHTIPLAFGVDRWNHAVQVLHKYDPNSVISNSFLRGLLTPYTSS